MTTATSRTIYRLDDEHHPYSSWNDRNLDAVTCSHIWIVGTGERYSSRGASSLAARPEEWLDVTGNTFILAMPEGSEEEFRPVANIVARALQDIEELPIIPREIEDILAISTAERRRWLDDGRLPSAGTRTVRLRGRARQITFHVFYPKLVEDLLNRGVVDEWREEDAAAKLEKRARAAYEAKLKRSLKKAGKPSANSKFKSDGVTSDLKGWDEFSRDGLLR